MLMLVNLYPLVICRQKITHVSTDSNRKTTSFHDTNFIHETTLTAYATNAHTMKALNLEPIWDNLNVVILVRN